MLSCELECGLTRPYSFLNSDNLTPIQPQTKGERFQGELLKLEVEVKDSRFSDGWAFFGFGLGSALKDVVAPLSGSAAASCVQCHTNQTAVERTFVQFYPTLLKVARDKGTLKPGF
ncbi:cytochrome P460 family protein [Nitrosomonas nitrosa]|uniref:cytochrome P460 family protein n=1 Tax=Nitrosomonas nitrosa TaxID=52442 RepID=UPI003C6E427E